MEIDAELEQRVSWQNLLGYLNFSEGKPDPRFRKQFNDLYAWLAERGVAAPWRELLAVLRDRLEALQASGASAFRETSQARAILGLVGPVLDAYRAHHADLLFHLGEADLFQPFFLVRVVEAILVQRPGCESDDVLVKQVLAMLNDFVGHRPVAILETRPRGEPYGHERVRPIPLYLEGAGVAWGRYRELVAAALDILRHADPDLLAEASFDLTLLEELALDPRAFDHDHPTNRRPNYVFGEWDPHRIDNRGSYRRFVLRKATLEALLHRVEHPGELPVAELRFEAAAVLAGTMLMASGTSGSGPNSLDSSASLGTLMPRIARNRDVFYTQLIRAVGGPHGQRLQQEATLLRQPFGGARQALNQFLAQQRALQQQHRHLAILFAEMGYPDASRQQVGQIPTPAVRMLSEVLIRLETGHLEAERRHHAQAARLLAEIEELLQRGIACGALADPWNILGFQGLFPLSAAREDSVRDQRIDDLLYLMERLLALHARLQSEVAAAGDRVLRGQLQAQLRQLASWWDRFASFEVGDVRRVHGGEAAAAAEHVAAALASWHERGEAAADLAFWRQHLDNFRSPQAFALVVDALLRHNDYQAAMALLINWLSQAEQVPLEEGEYSFHQLALRWMLGVHQDLPEPSRAKALAMKFLDYLEANADDHGTVPQLEAPELLPMPKEVEGDDLYGAAYEEMVYRDSTDDSQEGSVLDGGPRHEFILETESPWIEKRLRFQATLARLWHLAAWQGQKAADAGWREALGQWLASARHKQERMLALLDSLHACPIPEPIGTEEALIDYDRRRVIKEQLLHGTIAASLELFLSIGGMRLALGSEVGPSPRQGEDWPTWEQAGLRLEQALLRGDAAAARLALPGFLSLFREEPLLFTALSDGGHPRQLFRARLTQTILRALATNLPRLGLLRETFTLLTTARDMEQARRPDGRSVTEFNHVFDAAFRSVVEAVVAASDAWTIPAPEQELVGLLRRLVGPFLSLWMEHSRTLQLSALDRVHDEDDWQALRSFVQRYGGELFDARFLTMGNLRGLLHRGIGSHLDYLRDNPDPIRPLQLIEDLDSRLSRDEAIRHMQIVLQAVVENYEEYKDYNTTTTQSDYGENLHILLDFLHLKAAYQRHAWQFRPLAEAHAILAREGKNESAFLWQVSFTQLTHARAHEQLEELARLERTHGMRLRTVGDLLQERLVRPLQIDRLCALVEPAMEAARYGTSSDAFTQFEKELSVQTAMPTGVGLDVPGWLRRLEQEVHRVRAKRTALADRIPDSFEVPRVPLPYQELQRQLTEWELSKKGE